MRRNRSTGLRSIDPKDGSKMFLATPQLILFITCSTWRVGTFGGAYGGCVSDPIAACLNVGHASFELLPLAPFSAVSSGQQSGISNIRQAWRNRVGKAAHGTARARCSGHVLSNVGRHYEQHPTSSATTNNDSVTTSADSRPAVWGVLRSHEYAEQNIPAQMR